MASVENIEWLNQNLLRTYPLREDSDLTPKLTSGAVATGISVPTMLITDFTFTLPFYTFDGNIPSLTGITHTAEGFTLEISLGDVVLTSITAPISQHINTPYPLIGISPNADCCGWIVLGDLVRAADLIPEGAFRFDPDQLQFEVSTLRMSPYGVRSISAVGKYGLITYPPLYGHVKLMAGNDMVVSVDKESNSIWLKAESNAGYERTAPCDCEEAQSNVIRSINGMPAQDVQIIGDGNCVTVTQDASANTVKISDSCATPCCGCAELNFVNSAIQVLSKSIATLQAYASELEQRITNLDVNVTTTKASISAYPHNLTMEL